MRWARRALRIQKGVAHINTVCMRRVTPRAIGRSVGAGIALAFLTGIVTPPHFREPRRVHRIKVILCRPEL